MEFEKLLKEAKCCICEKPIKGSKHINLVALSYMAEWKFPQWGNVISKTSGRAGAVICDQCLKDDNPKIKFAIEFNNGQIIYHDVTKLKRASELQ